MMWYNVLAPLLALAVTCLQGQAPAPLGSLWLARLAAWPGGMRRPWTGRQAGRQAMGAVGRAASEGRAALPLRALSTAQLSAKPSRTGGAEPSATPLGSRRCH